MDAVNRGLLDLKDACNRYALTVEEFRSWQEAIGRHGVAGLKAKMAQERRNEARRSISEPAVAMLPSAEAGVDCYITDISSKGARLEFPTALEIPWNFELLCTRTRRSVRVCRVWQRAQLVGVGFQLASLWAAEAGLDTWLLGERT